MDVSQTEMDGRRVEEIPGEGCTDAPVIEIENERGEETGNVSESASDASAQTNGLEEKLEALTVLLNERLLGLENEFSSKLKYDQHKDKIIDKLHREVQDYKSGLLQNLLRPVIMDVIHTIDDIGRLADSHKSKKPEELDPVKLLNQMEGFAADLEEILYRQGVEAYHCEGLGFDPKRQKIVKTRSTEDESLNHSVCKRVHNGYCWDEKTFRPEMVHVYKYEPGSIEPVPGEEEKKEKIEENES